MAVITLSHVTKEFQLGQVHNFRNSVGRLLAQIRGRHPERKLPFKALDDVNFAVEEGEVLGIIGTYGTMALLVAQRRREIGIRVALGAHPSEAVSLMLKQGMTWTALGLGLGILGALISTFWLSRYIERLTWSDPIAFLSTTLLMAATAGAACYFPARRASRMDPMVVLRDE